MPNIFTIGQSALSAAQAGLSTAGQNIANASTVGYSRQSVVQSSASQQAMGFGQIGQGVRVLEIQRHYSDYLGMQALSTGSASSQLKAEYAQASQIDELLMDSASGLSEALQDVFGSLQQVSASPADVTTRQLFLSSLQSLVSRFQNVGERLEGFNQGVNMQLQSGVQSLNAAAQKIASLNAAIEAQKNSGSSQQPNQLLDERNQALVALSEQVKVSVRQENGQYSVYIGNGQPLVVGSQANTLTVGPTSLDPRHFEIRYDNPGMQSVLTSSSLAGGQLGGLLKVREDMLRPTQNEIGRLALTVASAFNTVQAQGITPSGQSGPPLFHLPSYQAGVSANNTGTAQIGVAVSEIGRLGLSEYRVEKQSSGYVLFREDDHAVVKASSSWAQIQEAARSEGLSLTLQGEMAQGDVFKLSPLTNAASGISIALSQAQNLATASRLNAPGDNSNVLKMLDIQSAKLLEGGTLSLQSAYSQRVNRVGSQTHELSLISTSAEQIHTQAKRAVDDVAGVNLDEEAAQLLRYQQAYQAAGKVMQIAKQMFDSLLQIQ